jgi:hypothetical protein
MVRIWPPLPACAVRQCRRLLLRTCRSNGRTAVFDPSLPSTANFCFDAQLCPLVGFILDGHVCMRQRKFNAFLGSAAVAWLLAPQSERRFPALLMGQP